jgi:hypothetical protein
MPVFSSPFGGGAQPAWQAIITGMQMTHFHKLRSGLQVNAPPAAPGVLADRAAFLHRLLEGLELFSTVEVEHTDDPDRLLVGLCTYPQSLAEEKVEAGLERLWVDWLSYPFWEVHCTYVEQGHVELEAASRESVLGHYVTVHLLCQEAAVPAQRSAEEAG